MLLLVPAILLAVLGALVGARASRKALRIAGLVAIFMAVPWLLITAYYTHLFDVPAYFQWRSAPSTDWLATGVGFATGLLVGVRARATRSTGAHIAAVPILACIAVAVAFAKPWLQPQVSELNDAWDQGVCIQTSVSSCGACATATLLSHFDIAATEAGVAGVADTRLGGTPNWRLARVLRDEGLEATFRTPDGLEDISPPALVGVRLGSPQGAAHFIVLLDRVGDEWIVGEPLEGRLALTTQQFQARYHFDHFALEVSR